MKNSGIPWIGEIPSIWDVVPFRSYVIERSEKNKGERTRELLALSFSLGVTLYRDKVFNMDRVKENYEDYQLVYENDLVLSPNDIIKGSVFVSKYYGCISPMYCVFSTRDNNIHYLPYLSYLLRTKEAGRLFFFIARGLIGEILDNGKYVTRRMTVSKQDLLSFKVLLPPIDEQKTITTFLDKKCSEIDEMVVLQEKIIEELKAYKQSVITEAVTKGLDPTVPMKDSEIKWNGKIPNHWKETKTLFLLTQPITDGPHETPIAVESGVPFISADAVSEGEIDFSHKWGYISEDYYQECCKKYIPQIEDIYMIKSGASTGRTAIVKTKEKFTIWSPLAVFRANKNRVLPYFLFYFLKSYGYQKQVETRWSYGTQQNIGMRTLEKLIISYPSSIEEQQQIVNYLDKKCSEIDQLISLKQTKIDQLKEYKKSLIYECVTGKKEVV